MDKIQKLKYAVRYVQMPKGSMWDNRLTERDKELLAYLALMSMNKRYCYPTLRFICALCNLDFANNRRNVLMRLAKLESLNYIKRTQRLHEIKGNLSTIYEILYDPSDEVNPDLLVKYGISEDDFDDFEDDSVDNSVDNPVYSEGGGVVAGNHGGGGSGLPPININNININNKEKEIEEEKEILSTFREGESSPSSRSLSHRLPLDSGEDLQGTLNLTPGEELPLLQAPIPKTKPSPHPALIKPAEKVGVTKEIPYWSEVCEGMSKVNPAFEHWKENVQFIGVSNGKLRLKARTGFHSQVFEQRFAADLLKVAKKMAVHVTHVQIMVAN